MSIEDFYLTPHATGSERETQARHEQHADTLERTTERRRHSRPSDVKRERIGKDAGSFEGLSHAVG
eukprot:439434-Rhodomonas_salina.1